MKRLVLFSVAMLMAGFGAQSCMDNDIEPDPMAPGIEIYTRARLQNIWAMDGANIAFRLNILLTEAANQYTGGEAIDLNSVIVGSDVNLFGKLFASGTVIAPSTFDGTVAQSYTIVYKDDVEIKIDNRRKGSVIIDTNDELLSDDDASWTVRNDTGDPMYANLDYNPYSGGYIYAAVNFGDYSIDHYGNRQWAVDIDGYTAHFTDAFKSDWSSGMMVETSFDEWDYASVSAADAEIEIYGVGQGKTMFYTANGVHLDMRYEIEDTDPMVYTPGACSWNFFESATEIARINNFSAVDVSVYPAAEARVVTTSAGNCRISQTLTYNGLVKVY